MLVRLVYASRSTQPIDNEVVTDILSRSRERNLETGITGVLCVCQDDVYLQVLEGGREVVNRLYSRLLLDPRHAEVTLLDYAEIDERRFFSWRMGRVDMDRLNAGVILRYSETRHLDPFRVHGRIALPLLEELMRTASIIGGN